MINQDPVVTAEQEYDRLMSQPVKSIFDYTEDVEPLGPESMKRPDGTYTCNPSLEGYVNGTEKFGGKNG